MVNYCVMISIYIKMRVTLNLLKSNCRAIYLGKIHLPSSSIQLDCNSLNWSLSLGYVILQYYYYNNCKNLFDLNEQVVKFYATIHSFISNCVLNQELVALEILKRKCTPTILHALKSRRNIFLITKLEM